MKNSSRLVSFSLVYDCVYSIFIFNSWGGLIGVGFGVGFGFLSRRLLAQSRLRAGYSLLLYSQRFERSFLIESSGS